MEAWPAKAAWMGACIRTTDEVMKALSSSQTVCTQCTNAAGGAPRMGAWLAKAAPL